MWTVNIGDKKVCLDDLSPAEFQEVADRHSLSWLSLYYNPAANIDAYHDLLVVCADHAGVEAPEKPDTMGDAKALLDLIVMDEDDDRPKVGAETESPNLEDDQATT